MESGGLDEPAKLFGARLDRVQVGEVELEQKSHLSSLCFQLHDCVLCFMLIFAGNVHFCVVGEKNLAKLSWPCQAGMSVFKAPLLSPCPDLNFPLG